MSAAGAVHAALVAAVRDGLGAQLNGVFEGPAVRASPPFAEVGELQLSDWGTKDRAGRELRTRVTIRDVGDAPARIHALAGACEDAVAELPRDLGGWRVASVALVRTRVTRGGPGQWSAVVEHRVRVLAE